MPGFTKGIQDNSALLRYHPQTTSSHSRLSRKKLHRAASYSDPEGRASPIVLNSLVYPNASIFCCKRFTN